MEPAPSSQPSERETRLDGPGWEQAPGSASDRLPAFVASEGAPALADDGPPRASPPVPSTSLGTLDGTPALALNPPPPATLGNGRFVIDGELGHGGMGVVYRARQVDLDREVAIKMLRPDTSVGPAAASRRERFQREARLSARLRHPNVVSLYEVGQESEALFFSMELCRGETLGARLSKGPLPAGEACQLLAKVLDGLACAHKEGLVHRDLKPGNVMLLGDGEPKIMDFGLACEVDQTSQDRLTREGTLLGTPHYMPPEQIGGATGEIDARSDIWACGVLLYEMVTGQLPFHADSIQGLMRAIFWEEPVGVRARRPEVPWEVEAIALKALEKRPDDRYQSAAEMRGDLLRFLAGEPILALKASALQRLSRRVARQKLVLPLLVALLVAVLATALAVRSARARSEEARAAVLERVHAGARERIEALFGSAHRMLRLLQRRAAQAELPLDREPFRTTPGARDPAGDRLARELLAVLNSWEEFSWVSWSTNQGDFVGAYRLPEEGFLRLAESWVALEGGQARTVADQHIQRDEGFLRDEERARTRPADYDPRQRPFYLRAQVAHGVVWTAPYVFWEGAPGITAAAAVRDAQGAVRGVLTIDFQTGQLAAELGKVARESAGEVLLFTPDGQLLATTREGQVPTRGRGDEAVLVRGEESGDALTRAFFAARAGGGQRLELAVDGVGWTADVRAIRVAGLDLAVAVLVPQ